jgi:hypothetical protein
MFARLLGFGVQIREFVQPVFELFTKDGVAPLLAFALFLFAIGIAIWGGLQARYRGIKPLKVVAKAMARIRTPQDFISQYRELDTILSNAFLIKSCWQEFKKTLIPPDDNIGVFRNTIRPSYFINIHHVESYLRLKRLHFYSNLLIGIGLLLTFIGLVAALTQAGAAIGQGGADIQSPIKKLLAVAAFKFWTSVSGLGSSIILRVCYEFIHNHLRAIVDKINAGLERGLQFVTPEYLAIEQLREAQEQTKAMKTFSTDFAVSLAKEIQPIFAGSITPLHDSLKELGQKITGGFGDALQGAAGSEMQAFSQNLAGIVQSLNSSKTEMDSVATTIRITMNEAAEALRASSGAASNEMAQQLRDVITTLAEENRKQAIIFDQSLQKISGAMGDATNEAGSQIRNAAQSMASGLNGVGDGVRDAAGTMAIRLDDLSTVLQTIEDRMRTHIQAMETLTGRANDTEKAMGTTARLLTEAGEPVAKASERMSTTAEQLNQSIQSVQLAVSDTHRGFTDLSQKMAETQNVLQNSWQSYERRFGSVDENLARALQGIVDNVKNNVDSMSAFVRDVDLKLSETVTIFAGNISELTESAESFESAAEKLLSGVKILHNQPVS